MILSRPALFAALLFLAACGDSKPSSSLSTTTDSAGVTIVVGPAVDSALPWRLTEVRRIGGADSGMSSFTRASSGVVATDGRATIAVLDWESTEQIQLFDSTGTWQRSVGAKGGGPGELLAPAGITMDRDGRLIAFDWEKMALVQWAADGAPLPEIKWSQGEGFPYGVPRFHGDSMMALVQLTDSLRRVTRLEVRTPRGTVALDSTVGPAPKMVMLSCVGLSLPPLFTGQLAWAMGPGTLFTTPQTTYQVDVREGTRLVRSVRRAIAPVAATKQDASRLYPEGMKVRFGGGRECVTPSEEVAEKIGVAATLPMVKAMAVAPNGELWVQRYTFEGETPSVDVFDAGGAYLGTVTGKGVPLGFLGNDLILFSIENPDDGTSIIGVYRIARS
ncbi:MAG TPA: 6-bladed beta-propeller [Gemmatimonadales bacterium]|nr:6-bladed beta-propeller [Gemmatimonadales bacterium]